MSNYSSGHKTYYGLLPAIGMGSLTYLYSITYFKEEIKYSFSIKFKKLSLFWEELGILERNRLL